MNRMKKVILTTLLTAFASSSMLAVAQAQIPRNSDRFDNDRNRRPEVVESAERLDSKTTTFRRELDRALDGSRLNNTPREDEINQYVRDFEKKTDEMADRLDDDEDLEGLFREVSKDAQNIKNWLGRNRLNMGTNVERAWDEVMEEVQTLRTRARARRTNTNPGIRR
jgi:Ni/Co efflux regulator RcnB